MELQEAIYTMFSTPAGQVVLKSLRSKADEPTFEAGIPDAATVAVHREGCRHSLLWLINNYNSYKEGNIDE